jgi:hypothetical protein
VRIALGRKKKERDRRSGREILISVSVACAAAAAQPPRCLRDPRPHFTGVAGTVTGPMMSHKLRLRVTMEDPRVAPLQLSYLWHMPRTLSTSLHSYGIHDLWAYVYAHVYAHFPVAIKAASAGIVLQSNKIPVRYGLRVMSISVASMIVSSKMDKRRAMPFIKCSHLLPRTSPQPSHLQTISLTALVLKVPESPVLRCAVHASSRKYLTSTARDYTDSPTSFLSKSNTQHPLAYYGLPSDHGLPPDKRLRAPPRLEHVARVRQLRAEHQQLGSAQDLRCEGMSDREDLELSTVSNMSRSSTRLTPNRAASRVTTRRPPLSSSTYSKSRWMSLLFPPTLPNRRLPVMARRKLDSSLRSPIALAKSTDRTPRSRPTSLRQS